MKVVYNEAKAKENYQKYKNNTKKRNIISNVAAVSAILGIFMLVGGEYAIFPFHEAIAWIGLIITPISLAVVAFFSTRIGIPLDAAYYEISQSYRILEVTTSLPLDKELCNHYPVRIVTENEDGIVAERSIGEAILRKSTQVSNKTLDLHQGIVFEAYINIQSEKESLEKSKQELHRDMSEHNKSVGCVLCNFAFDTAGELIIDLKKDGYGECHFCPNCGRKL